MLQEWVRICCTVLCQVDLWIHAPGFSMAARTTRIRLFKQALAYAKHRHLYAGLCRHTECRKSHSNPWGLILWESLLSICRPLVHPVDSNLTSCDTFTSLKVKTSTSAPTQAEKGLIALANWHTGIYPHGYVTLFLDIIIQFVGTACGQNPTKFVLDV